MTTCTCPQPIRGPGTLTDYTGPATVYSLCSLCGLPIAGSGQPETQYANLKRRQAVKLTVRGE